MRSELLFSVRGARALAAFREDGATVEFRVEQDRDPFGVGRILKARVAKVLPGIQSAFLDVGRDRDAFLHVSDLLLPGELVEPEPSEAEDLATSAAGEYDTDDDGDAGVSFARSRRRESVRQVPIEERLREGRELLVQVARESIGSKGARVTCTISLPGRYLVYMPQVRYRGVSRRIADPEERSRLRGILANLPMPGGFIVRTAGQEAGEEAFRADALRLARAWERIQDEALRVPAPAAIHEENDLLLRLLRDLPREGLDRIVVDDPDVHERAIAYLRDLDPVMAQAVRLHADPTPLLDAAGVAPELERALRPKVWLRSGGYVVIEQTEALVSVDVNTGKFVGARHPEETILRTNLEAAVEIARQLRLRDLGGIIVIDFIDMERAESRRQVLDTLEEALRRDRARTKVLGLSDLGLVQLTRKRTRAGLLALLTRPCPCCQGTGRLKSPETVAADAITEAERLHAALGGESVTIRAHPEVARAVRRALELARGGPGRPPGLVRVEDDSGAGLDQFDVIAV